MFPMIFFVMFPMMFFCHLEKNEDSLPSQSLFSTIVKRVLAVYKFLLCKQGR